MPRGAKDAKPASRAPKIVLTLGDKPKLDAEKLAAFVARDPSRYRLTPQMKLVFSPSEKEWATASEDPIPLCRELLRKVTDEAKRRA